MTEDYSSKALRAAMKAKAERLASGSDATKIGASTFTPAEPLNADVQTGARPITRRRFKSGGKVVGASNAPRADKPKRGNGALSADSLINRNVVEANEEREGKKHVGAFKSGGRAKHATDGKVKGKPTVKDPYANDPYAAEISTRGITGPGGKYITADEIRNGIDAPPMPPTMPDDIRASRNAEAAASANANMGKKSGGKAEAKCWGGSTKKADGGRAHKLSGGLLARYAKKASRQGDMAARMSNNGQKADMSAIANKRQAGVQMALNKLQDKTVEDRKDGGRAKKFMGGPMMQPGGMMSAAPQGPSGPIVDTRDQMVARNRMNFGTGPSGSPYKKGGKVAFEGSAKDEAQDAKLAKKYGMKMAAWEKSKMDKKHDEQGSMEGLKKGGRAERKRGGRTNINIVIASGKPQDGMMPNNGGMPPKMPPVSTPVQAPPVGMMPPMAGAGGPPPMPPAGAPPMPPMGRKAGGKVYRSYKDMDAGAGSGMGRLEKTEIAERKPRKAGGKAYKSYKDMDAGAGTGMGRLEKTEIAARHR